MDKMDILVWAIGIGFTAMFTMMGFMWKALRGDMKSLDEKVTDIDRRLCRLEGAFYERGHLKEKVSK